MEKCAIYQICAGSTCIPMRRSRVNFHNWHRPQYCVSRQSQCKRACFFVFICFALLAELCLRSPQDLLSERGQLQQQLADQLLQLSALRARLEHSRLAAEMGAEPQEPSRARLAFLQTELDSAAKLIKAKEKQVRLRGAGGCGERGVECARGNRYRVERLTLLPGGYARSVKAKQTATVAPCTHYSSLKVGV